jgi:23S rRNA (cytidine1920-2'-O)/16S rRNA (cytidine1409-2'-O)-methyltransferase
MKKRIDQLLVERGIAESRHKAQALLLAGQVLVNEQKILKSGQTVNEESNIRLLDVLPFASRAGGKLQAALDHFHIVVSGRACVDLGASTGGFTDCLLQNGASRIYAYDVGKGQLAWKLRGDERIAVIDEFNVRNITARDLPEGVSLVTADLSFISLTKVLIPLRGALLARMALDAESAGRQPVDLVLLVKPQFEVGKEGVGKGGIVRDPEKRRIAVETVERFAHDNGYVISGRIPSPIIGTKGNEEFLLHLQLLPDLLSTL